MEDDIDYLGIMEREFRRTLDLIDQYEDEHQDNCPEWVLTEYLEQFANKVLEDYSGDEIDIDNHLAIRHTYRPVKEKSETMELKVYFRPLDNLGETFCQIWQHERAAKA